MVSEPGHIVLYRNMIHKAFISYFIFCFNCFMYLLWDHLNGYSAALAVTESKMLHHKL